MTQLVVWLNALANGVGRVALAPVGVLPGWLSATLIAAVTGLVALVAFKYTSNQRAILSVRRDIQADLLCLSLFKEDVLVSLLAQGRVVVSALKLLLLAIVPMAVLTVPMALLLGQLALWYQVRPLAVGEEAVLTLNLAGASSSAWPDVRLESIGGAEATRGPVRIRSQRRICWTFRAQDSGSHRITFDVAGQKAEKELAVGSDFQRTSPMRPGWNWSDMLLYPAEEPFRPESPVQSIEIDYPIRPGWICGSNSWLLYWFLVSMLVAFAFRRVLNVNV